MIKMRFDGGQQLAKNLGQLSNRVSRSVQREALREGAEPIRSTVQATAPRDPGAPDLADNILVGTKIGANKEVAIGIGISRGFFYDWFNEFGTARQSARPFWRPAFDSESPRSLKIIAGAMWHALIKRGFGSSRGSGGGVGL